jgi:broad specificity phosphatase PhoE
MTARLVKPVLLLLVLSASAVAQGPQQPVIFLVRHAERADTARGAPPSMASDPDLSKAGRERARALAAMLKDAGITTIIVSEFKRSQHTAAPLAEALGLTVTKIKADDVSDVVAKLKATTTGNVLVVGHSNTVPQIIRSLDIDTPVEIGDADFDNLFIVLPGTPRRLVRLHYR